MTEYVIWLRNYFTDAEIQEYKDNILAGYFPQKVNSEQKPETQSTVQRRERRNRSETKRYDKKTSIRQSEIKK